MPRPLRSSLRLAVSAVFVLGAMDRPLQAVPTVWTGLTITVTKPDFADPADFADAISPSVALTRGDTQGLFNIAQESGYDKAAHTRPSGTRWASKYTTPGANISASNWAALDFSTWHQAYGSAVGAAIVDEPAVLHLIAEDVYLDIQFTSWTSSFGGGFSYLRADGEIPDPPLSPTGDYNQNGVVDAADYTVWRDTFGQTVSLGEGADGDADGLIDAGDYDYWKAHFGEILPAASAAGAAKLSSSSMVPDPTAILALLTGTAILVLTRLQRIPRGPGQTFGA